MEPIIRQAVAKDATAIYRMIIELAEYEKAADQIAISVEQIRDTLFEQPVPGVEALIYEISGQAFGYAVFFTSYSTWLGKPGIYMEDLYISPTYRGKGAGKQMLRHIAQLALERGCGRVEWSVLDWNQPAIEFYESIGAIAQSEWVRYRLADQVLYDFAQASV